MGQVSNRQSYLTQHLSRTSPTPPHQEAQMTADEQWQRRLRAALFRTPMGRLVAHWAAMDWGDEE